MRDDSPRHDVSFVWVLLHEALQGQDKVVEADARPSPTTAAWGSSATLPAIAAPTLITGPLRSHRTPLFVPAPAAPPPAGASAAASTAASTAVADPASVEHMKVSQKCCRGVEPHAALRTNESLDAVIGGGRRPDCFFRRRSSGPASSRHR